MKKQTYRIDGFIDRGSLKVGDRMEFLDKEGVWRRTSPITYVQVSGNKVYVETENSIYMNYDQQIEQTQNKTLEQALAEKYLNSEKHMKFIGGYDIDKLIMMDQNGQQWSITPDKVQTGMHIQLGCNVLDMETGLISSGTLDIPRVQDFIYQEGQLIIESRSSVFSNVDFSKELAELKMEHDKSQNVEIDR